MKFLPILSLLLAIGCTSPSPQNTMPETALAEVPQWAREAIWYQIFVERFRNGDPSNDPTAEDITGADPAYIPEGWSVTPWGHDWYKREDWINDSKANGFYHQIQQRRFGGDLQGVLDKVDYIASLGVNAVYFNPLNDSPSLHKYDARNYRHIDRNFGPDPEGDKAIMEAEVPDDPATWKWTAADKLFLEVVEAFHQRGIRVILDYSWNHTGPEFWAIKDIRKNGEASQYADWFNIKAFDDPATPEDEFEYEGWAGYMFMPVVNKDIIPEDDHQMPFEGNLHSQTLKQHIFNVSARWLDPNGDGDPGDGIDGYRLDVAGEVPMGFWRDYRKAVRAINPDAYILGEIWWLEWPEKMLGPRPFLQGDQFDAIMNYRWYRIARGLFAQAGPVLKPSEFVAQIDGINKDITMPRLQAMMNMSSSHDAPRLSTSFYNKNLNKYHAKPSDDPAYKINKPDGRTFEEIRLFLLHQFTFIGAPQIWNGDEMGMWGADDPDCRKPLIWDDITYEDETAHFFEGTSRDSEPVVADKELAEYYRQMTALRNNNPTLIYGELEFLVADDTHMTLAYSRKTDETEIIAAFNRSDSKQVLQIPVSGKGSYQDLLDSSKSYSVSNNKIEVELEPLKGVVLNNEQMN